MKHRQPICPRCSKAKKLANRSYCRDCYSQRNKTKYLNQKARIAAGLKATPRLTKELCNCRDPQCTGLTCTFLKVVA